MTRLLVALGGNAIQRAHDAGTWAAAVRQMRRTAAPLAEIVAAGHELVVTHGNGPQVGNLLREAELGQSEIPLPPLDVVVSESEGQIGYLIAGELEAALNKLGSPRTVLPIVSRTEVSRQDHAFRSPTKPIGGFYTTRTARRLIREKGWTMQEDRVRGGWRRLVPSPRPIRWLEGDAVRTALDAGLGSRCVFVVTGGGGIPVVRGRRTRWDGVEAVIDKDHTAAMIASQLGASTLAIVTDVRGAAVGFGTAHSRWLGRITAEELASYLAAGEFEEGSMQPKVTAGLEFLRRGGEFLVITDIASLPAALAGTAGTRVGRLPEVSRRRARGGRVAHPRIERDRPIARGPLIGTA